MRHAGPPFSRGARQEGLSAFADGLELRPRRFYGPLATGPRAQWLLKYLS